MFHNISNLPEDALGTPEEQGIRAMLISPPRRWQKLGISPSSITRRSWKWEISTPF